MSTKKVSRLFCDGCEEEIEFSMMNGGPIRPTVINVTFTALNPYDPSTRKTRKDYHVTCLTDELLKLTQDPRDDW